MWNRLPNDVKELYAKLTELNKKADEDNPPTEEQRQREEKRSMFMRVFLCMTEGLGQDVLLEPGEYKRLPRADRVTRGLQQLCKVRFMYCVRDMQEMIPVLDRFEEVWKSGKVMEEIAELTRGTRYE